MIIRTEGRLAGRGAGPHRSGSAGGAGASALLSFPAGSRADPGRDVRGQPSSSKPEVRAADGSWSLGFLLRVLRKRRSERMALGVSPIVQIFNPSFTRHPLRFGGQSIPMGRSILRVASGGIIRTSGDCGNLGRADYGSA